MLEVIDIRKSFGENNVLNGVSLKINDGDVYGLIGSNGAGKTTLMNIICTVLPKDGGRVLLDGREIKAASDLGSDVGYFVDIPAMFEFFTGYEYLNYLASSTGLNYNRVKERADELFRLTGLNGVGNKQIKTFSRGMKQKMGIVSGLFNNPKILIMDEPSSALDPAGRADMEEIIKSLKNQGKTILLSTHILSDAEKICNKIGLLADGVIVTQGNIGDILGGEKEAVYDIQLENEENANILKEALVRFNPVSVEKAGVIVRVKLNDMGGAKKLLKFLADTDLNIVSFSLKKETLQDIYLKTVKK